MTPQDPLERVADVPEGWYRENPIATSILVDSLLAVARAAEAVALLDSEGNHGTAMGNAIDAALRSTAQELIP